MSSECFIIHPFKKDEWLLFLERRWKFIYGPPCRRGRAALFLRASFSATASDREGDGIPRHGGCFAGGLDCWHVVGAPRGNWVVGFSNPEQSCGAFSTCFDAPARTRVLSLITLTDCRRWSVASISCDYFH